MQFGAGHRLGAGGIVILALISLFALFVAFAVVPAIAQRSGLSESAVTYIVAAWAGDRVRFDLCRACHEQEEMIGA